ncbi:hypothetical protein NE463_21050, partial [Anaerotruncus colihominis]|nr:hypothetical protein [Anaerotruncus colihominis]
MADYTMPLRGHGIIIAARLLYAIFFVMSILISETFLPILKAYLPDCIIGYGNHLNGGACMMISSKGRYALRVMVDLAEHQGEGY